VLCEKDKCFIVIGVVVLLLILQGTLLWHSFTHNLEIRALVGELDEYCDYDEEVFLQFQTRMGYAYRNLLAWVIVSVRNVLHGAILLPALRCSYKVIAHLEQQPIYLGAIDEEFFKWRNKALVICSGASLLIWVLVIASDISTFAHQRELVSIADSIFNPIQEMLNILSKEF